MQTSDTNADPRDPRDLHYHVRREYPGFEPRESVYRYDRQAGDTYPNDHARRAQRYADEQVANGCTAEVRPCDRQPDPEGGYACASTPAGLRSALRPTVGVIVAPDGRAGRWVEPLHS